MTAAIGNFLDFLSRDRAASDNTVAAYRTDLRQLAAYVGGHSQEPASIAWEAVGQPVLESFVLDLRRRGYRDSSVARKVAASRAFFAFLVQEGAVPCDPTAGLPPPRVARAPLRALSPAELEELLQAQRRRPTRMAGRDAAILEIFCATGMRVSELVSLDVPDVHLGRRSHFVSCPGRTGAPEIPLLDAAASALRVYLSDTRPRLLRHRQEGALFVNLQGQRLTRQGVWMILKECARQAGLKGTINARTLRGAVAARMLGSGAPLREVQQILGHANAATTRAYAARPVG